jgi:peptidoglycan/LPS O-acetylase OafA/YrhL
MAGVGDETIASAFDRAGGRSSGFDYLRLGLAVSVLAWHSFRISDWMTDYHGWWGPFVRLILPMFFALSGFLVAGSLLRVKSIHHFLILRTMRIMPALAIQLLFSAVIIGGLLTTLPLADYLRDPLFLRYFLNIFGLVQWVLPGVFQSNPVTTVNASLWTIPYEIMAYLLIVALWIVGAIRRPRLLIPLILMGQFVAPVAELVTNRVPKGYGPLSGYVLVVAFTFGTALYICREWVPMRTSWAIASLVLALALLSTMTGGYFAGPPAAYFTVWLGLRNPRRIAAIASADISYGVYLYAYPIQQSVVALFPAWRLWWFIIPVSLFFTVLMAMLSWRYVEKPALGHRKSLMAWSDRVADRITGAFSRA